MAAIQPKNTTDILVDKVDQKTAATGVKIQSLVHFKHTGTVVPLTATCDIGSSTAAEHIRETFTKEVTSNGQALPVGTDSVHSLELKTNALTRVAIESDGDLAQDATNGGNLLWTKASTGIAVKHANTLTAAGTLISDALDLTAVFNVLTTVAASTGAQLWDAPVGTMIIVVNAGANALALYPHSGTGTINGGSAGVSVSIATASLALCVRDTSTNWIAREIAAPAA